MCNARQSKHSTGYRSTDLFVTQVVTLLLQRCYKRRRVAGDRGLLGSGSTRGSWWRLRSEPNVSATRTSCALIPATIEGLRGRPELDKQIS